MRLFGVTVVAARAGKEQLMKRHRAALVAAVVAAGALAAGTLAPGAQAWEQCPPGSHDEQYCEHDHHHHHHHHHDDHRAVDVRHE
jgi:hypothetical protein